MPVTPKGIWTPDDSDDWDLTIDLAAMANSVDAALTPALGTTVLQYTTVAALLATAPAGRTIASADNAPGGIWRRSSGVWQLITPPRFLNGTARNAVITAPVDGWQVYNQAVGALQTYHDSSTVASPGWYSEKVVNIFRRGSDVNTIPTANTDVSGSTANFTLDNPTYATFSFSGELQNNVAMSSQFMLNVDGADVATAKWERNESGGTPRVNIASQYGVLLPSGFHSVKLRTIANTAGLSVLTAPSWSMVGTLPLLGSY